MSRKRQPEPVPTEIRSLVDLAERRSQKTLRWPKLHEDALYGLAGEIIEATDPHSEADPVAILLSCLSAFGNAAGRDAYLRVGPTKHYPKLFVVLVGTTSKGRKGTSWDFAKALMGAVDHDWANRIENGLSSGEGLIYAVRDRVIKEDADGKESVHDEGVPDKRLMVVESEFSSTLKVASREGNTLSPVLRAAWDDARLSSMTRNSPLKSTKSHVSLLGHITRTELSRLLSDTDAENGFANRFLWAMVKRSKKLPFGGEWHKQDVSHLIRHVHSSLDFAKRAGEVIWGYSAKPLWEEAYDELSEGEAGLLGSVTSRSEAQTLRLALMYALMDGSRTIEEPHLRAALAVWRYCEDSARYAFGEATGDRVADRIEILLEDYPSGLTSGQIRDAFGRNKSSARIRQSLDLLESLARVKRSKEATGGRPAEKWSLC